MNLQMVALYLHRRESCANRAREIVIIIRSKLFQIAYRKSIKIDDLKD